MADDASIQDHTEHLAESGELTPPGADADAKRELLDAFYADLTRDLALLGVEAKERNAWMPGVMAFYGLEEAP